MRRLTVAAFPAQNDRNLYVLYTVCFAQTLRGAHRAESLSDVDARQNVPPNKPSDNRLERVLIGQVSSNRTADHQ